jgi:hypothetical protein
MQRHCAEIIIRNDVSNLPSSIHNTPCEMRIRLYYSYFSHDYVRMVCEAVLAGYGAFISRSFVIAPPFTYICYTWKYFWYNGFLSALLYNFWSQIVEAKLIRGVGSASFIGFTARFRLYKGPFFFYKRWYRKTLYALYFSHWFWILSDS